MAVYLPGMIWLFEPRWQLSLGPQGLCALDQAEACALGMCSQPAALLAANSPIDFHWSGPGAALLGCKGA